MSVFPTPPAGFAACRVILHGATLTHLVALDEDGGNGGRPTMCGLSRFDDRDEDGNSIPGTADLPGWGMGDSGVWEPGIAQIRCADCYDIATAPRGLDSAIGGVLFNVSNFPEKAQTRLLGQDMTRLRAKLLSAVMPFISAASSESAEDAPTRHEHRPGYACPVCGHVALRHAWVDEGESWPADDTAHQILTRTAADR